MVDAPCKAEMKMEGVIRASVAKIRTTSFGGTSPDVFRENVVRFETEDIGECAVCVKHTRVGGRELEKTGRRWGFTRSCVHGLYGDGRLIASWCAYTALVNGTPVHVIHRQLLCGNLTWLLLIRVLIIKVTKCYIDIGFCTLARGARAHDWNVFFY